MPRLFALLVSAAALAGPSHAADLQVQVGGISADTGEVGCVLFASDAGFPMQSAQAVQDWHKASQSGVTCRFPALRAPRFNEAAFLVPASSTVEIAVTVAP
jgi:uncharacterized protein (DUF2141 family)